MLIDSDIFCKLAIAELLEEAVGLFGVDIASCQRLAALPYMLKGGSLRQKLGTHSDMLIPIAEGMLVVRLASAGWLDKMTGVPDIDPGEAQLLAVAAEDDQFLLTGDKRALRAAKDVPGLAAALQARVIVLEAVVLGLCESIGVSNVRKKMRVMMAMDKTMRICFSDDVSDPEAGLKSYYDSLAAEVEPFVLWFPSR